MAPLPLCSQNLTKSWVIYICDWLQFSGKGLSSWEHISRDEVVTELTISSILIYNMCILTLSFPFFSFPTTFHSSFSFSLCLPCLKTLVLTLFILQMAREVTDLCLCSWNFQIHLFPCLANEPNINLQSHWGARHLAREHLVSRQPERNILSSEKTVSALLP
jgi:hypothetical protein